MTRSTMNRVICCAALAGITAAFAVPAMAYCLTGVRWPADAGVYYNSSGKITSGQCTSNLDGAVTGGIGAWRAIFYAGTTTKTANKRDNQNTVGWSNLGGQTLGITNYLQNDRFRTVQCGPNLFANLYEADVRITTQYRWASGSGPCPCAAGSAFFVDDVATHEFGHVIGLCHVGTPSSLMYPSFGVCENKSKTGDENAGENALCY